MDRLTALSVFRHVVEQGSFAAAARRLGLSPAAASKNINELEDHLKARLFNRTTRRVSLTETGERYYADVVRVLDDLTAADEAVRPQPRKPEGLLRVSAPMSLALLFLSPHLPAFLARYPDIALDLRMDDRRTDVIGEGYDLAIRGSDRLEDSSLIARPLLVMSHVVCGAPDYFRRAGMPRAPADLEQHNCIKFSLSGHVDEWRFRRGQERVGVAVEGRFRVTSSLAVRDALLAGYGLSLIPRMYVQDDLARGRLQTVLDDWSCVRTTVYAVYPSRRHVPLKLRVFLDFLFETLAPGSAGGA